MLIDGDTSARDELLSALADREHRQERIKALKEKFIHDFDAGGDRERLSKFRDKEAEVHVRIDRIMDGGPVVFSAPAPVENDLGGIDLAHAAKNIKSEGNAASLNPAMPQSVLDEKNFAGFTFTIFATSKVTSPDILFR